MNIIKFIKSPRIVKTTFVTGIIYLICQIIFFAREILFTESSGLRILLVAVCLILSFLTCAMLWNLYRYVSKRKKEKLAEIEYYTCAILLQTIIMLIYLTLLGSVESLHFLTVTLFNLAFIMGFILILLGGVGFYKYRHSVNISFFLWGVYIVLFFFVFLGSAYGFPEITP